MLLCLVCLTLLASFFLPSHLSLKTCTVLDISVLVIIIGDNGNETTLCMRETKKHGKLTSVLRKYCTTSEPLISWKGMPPDPLAVHVFPTHMQMTDLHAKPL